MTINLNQTALREVDFIECKAMGLHFDDCNPFLFSIVFQNCNLELASFFEMNLRGTSFKSTSLKKVDFTKSNLSSVLIEECDLSGAIFEYTNLKETDLSTVYKFQIDPELNQIKKSYIFKKCSFGVTGEIWD